MLKYLTLFVCLLLLGSNCTQDRKDFDSSTETYQMVSKDYVKFPLDNETAKTHFAIQYFEINDSSYFSLFNRYKSTLYIYNYHAKTLKKKIFFEKEGPDGIINPAKIGYLIVSFDTIFLHEPFSNQLIHTNGDGKVVKKYKLKSGSESAYSNYTDVRTLKPMVYEKGKIYLTGLKVGIEPIPDHTQLENVYILDLKEARIEASPTIKRPDIYNQGQWGALFKYQLYGCFNHDTRRFIYSFGLEHNLYETDHNNLLKKHYAKSKYFEEEFKPLTKNKDITPMELPVTKRTEYDFTTPSYYAILYDPFKKCYYRFATPPLTKEQFDENKPFEPSVIILDENFERLGETRLPPQGTYNYSMMFINEKGLHIMHDNREENALVFVIFEPVKI